MNTRVLVAVLAIAVMYGCSNEPSNMTGDYVLPAELKSCKIYRVRGNNGLDAMTIVRCPNSATSTYYRSGKTSAETFVSDTSPPPPSPTRI